MQPLQVSKWAKGCNEITDADIWDDLKVLEDHRFVFVDEVQVEDLDAPLSLRADSTVRLVRLVALAGG